MFFLVVSLFGFFFASLKKYYFRMSLIFSMTPFAECAIFFSFFDTPIKIIARVIILFQKASRSYLYYARCNKTGKLILNVSFPALRHRDLNEWISCAVSISKRRIKKFGYILPTFLARWMDYMDNSQAQGKQLLCYYII